MFPADVDWINVETGADLSSFTNGKKIALGQGNPEAPNTGEAVAVHVNPNARISSFLNQAAGKITASTLGAAIGPNTRQATATAVWIEGTVPLLTNNGSIKALASATFATPVDAEANAFASGIDWISSGGPHKTATLTNGGSVVALAKAKATAATDASASGTATAVRQEATADDSAGSTAALTVANNSGGVIAAHGTATASATYGGARANASGTGVFQNAHHAQTETLSLTNSGKIAASGKATANAQTYAEAAASAVGVEQRANGDGNAATATAKLLNTGTIVVAANASAHGGASEYAFGFANAIGVDQVVLAAGSTTTSLTNKGDISASAISSVGGRFAFGGAIADGVFQDASGDGAPSGVAQAILTNSARSRPPPAQP